MNNIENLLACLPGGIERQEAAGQSTLVASKMLPKELTGVTREQLTAIGFKFGNDVDDLFVECELPPGWTKRATEHSMHSDILDEKGRKRAGIFYKAAFYDRSAHFWLIRRFRIDAYHVGSDTTNAMLVKDGDTVVYDAGEYPVMDYERSKVLETRARAWLKENYPDWQNPMAYWEATP